jgi:hypothetical protein
LRQESEEIRVRSEKIMIDLNYSIQKNWKTIRKIEKGINKLIVAEKEKGF